MVDMKGKKYGPCTSLTYAAHIARLDNNALDETAKASLLDRVGRCWYTLGQYSAAGIAHQQALAYRRKNLGEDCTDQLISMDEFESAVCSQCRYKEAESINRQTLAMREKVLGIGHPDTLITMNNLALSLNKQEKYEEVILISR